LKKESCTVAFVHAGGERKVGDNPENRKIGMIVKAEALLKTK